MSGYLTRLLAGAVHPQRTLRPRVAPLFGPPSTGPEWLLRESRPSRAKEEAGGVDAEHIFDGGAVSEDAPVAMPAPSPPRFAATGPTPVGAADPALLDPRIPTRTLRGDGRSAGNAGRDAAHAPSSGAQTAGAAAADEDAFARQPGRGHASNEAREHERSHPRVHEHAAASRDATRADTAPGDGAVAPLLDRWRPRRRSTETLRLDQASTEPDPGTAGRSAPRSAAPTPPMGERDMPESTAAPVRIARLSPHRDSEMELIRRNAPHPYHGSPQRGLPDHDAHSPHVVEAMIAAEAMAVAVRPASPAQSPAGRDTVHVGAAARRASPAASEPAQRRGVENRYDVEMRRADLEPTVHVTIGTVEIKAGARSTPPRPAGPAAPRVGLEEYLRRRRTGDST
jgi:hypothetical protein